MDTGLAGKRVLVTGGSGGIGAATARAFAGEAASRFTTTAGRERAETVASELDGAVAVQADLTREDDTDRLFGELRETFGGVEVCAAVQASGLRRTFLSGSCRSSAGARPSTPT